MIIHTFPYYIPFYNNKWNNNIIIFFISCKNLPHDTGWDKRGYHPLYLEPRKGSKSETITILQKHVDFAKDNLAHIVATEYHAENKHEAEDGDEKT